MNHLSRPSLFNGALSAWLLVVAFGCSGNTSLGGGGASNIGGASQTNAGGKASTGGKPSVGGTSSTSTYQPCNGKQCGDTCTICPPNSSDCAETAVVKACSLSGECRVGTQQCTNLASGGSPGAGGSAGGSPNSGGATSTGGAPSTGGASSTSTYVPCAGKQCGDTCTECPPNSSGCVETAIMKSCSLAGQCMAGNQQCTTASGGAPSTGGASSTSTYVPCAGKQCGDTCTECPPNSSGCVETAIMKSCSLGGQCLGGTQQCTTASGGAPSTGGSAATGGSASGVQCGAAVCGATEDCCNASCSLCVPKGNGCIAMVCTTGGSTSTGGATGAGGTTSITGLHTSCTNGTCPEGLTPIEYYGVAGTAGPLFCNCEIPCTSTTTGTSTVRTCPTGMQCTTVSDGPGTVCY
jgi:hypothetical protein